MGTTRIFRLSCMILNLFLFLSVSADRHDSVGAGSVQFLDKELAMVETFKLHGQTRNFNASCNNLQASNECADECENKLWKCIEDCVAGGEDQEKCLHKCGREEYGCVDNCPCYTGCPHGCPCDAYPCKALECEDQHYEEAVICATECIAYQNSCLAKCDAFDVLCYESCQKLFNSCINDCPCNAENEGAAQSRTLILYGGKARIFTWFSDNNEQIQTLTPDSGNSYFDFGTHSVGEGCTVFFQGKHWFIGGRYNPDGLAYLETHTDRKPPPGASQNEIDNFKQGCKLHDAGFILPDNFREHSCTVYQNEVWMCGSSDNPTRCYTFNGGGFLRKKDTSYPHAYGALENAYAFGLVIVGGASSGSSTELSHDGYAWVKGPGFPYQNNQGVSSVSIDGYVYVFGGTASKNKGYKLTVQGPDCDDNVIHEGCDLIWKWIGDMLTPRYYHRTIHQQKQNTVLHIGGEGGTEYTEKWKFNGTDYETVLYKKNSAYSINFNRPEAYPIQKDYCFPKQSFTSNFEVFP